MPDLFTHYASARLPGALLRGRRTAALLVAGTFLPDLASKSLQEVARTPSMYVTPAHSILGLLVLCYLAALFLEEPLRPRGFAALYAGALLHVAVDALKDALGAGAVHPFHPLSTAGIELSLVHPENVLAFLPLDLVLVLAAWRLERRLTRV
jgi:membrane-bound metal-dependent hydrolase YbcI (DUF457 family)